MPCHLQATRKSSPKVPGKDGLLLFPSSFWSQACGITRRVNRSRQPRSEEDTVKAAGWTFPLATRAAVLLKPAARAPSCTPAPRSHQRPGWQHSDTQMQIWKWAWHWRAHGSQRTANRLMKITEHSTLCKAGPPSRWLNCSL